MKKIDTSQWKTFNLSDLGFANYHGRRQNRANRIEGNIPLLTAGRENQGVATYISNPLVQYKDAITIDMFGNCFYHKGTYAGDDNIYFFVNDELSDYAKLFIATVLNTVNSKIYAYVEQFRQTHADALAIKLPITPNGLPNWNYMESYMRKMLKEAEINLVCLNQANKEAVKIDTGFWKTYRLDEIFYMRNTHSITQKDITPDSGNTPYVTASNINNGVMTYIDCPEEWKDKGHCIMIGGKTLTFSYQQHDFCSNDSHNIALYAIDSRGANELCYLFMISALRSAFSSKYSWSDSISMKKIKDEMFSLPSADDGSPDWDYMASYMRKMLKQTKVDIDLLTNAQT